ncbi:MAG: O-antigen ligase family protein, partial [Eubacteriales bacterium]
ALISGRRALQVIVILTPLLILIIKGPSRELIKRRFNKIKIALLIGVFFVISYLLINNYYDVQISKVYFDITNAFVENFDSTNSVRRQQFFALIEGWKENPILGSGSGAPAPGYIRDVNMPWAYELVYVAKLFHTGLVGFIIYSLQIFWIYLLSYRIIKSKSHLKYYTISIITGMTAFLIANASNPYLEKYDYMWVVFLPIAIINTWLIERPKEAERYVS